MQRITLAHGSGGKITHQLISDVFFKHLGNPELKKCDDAAIVVIGKENLAMTTDSFVIKPLFFPGGDIGKLAICGTVNDLAVSGANPQYISCGLIIEDGFDKESLVKIVKSMAHWANIAGVKIIAGDTKVVEKNAADGIFINTTGIGALKQNSRLAEDEIEIGDKIIITGTVGDHGIAVLSKRKNLNFDTELLSDCAPLNKMLMRILDETKGIRFMRDPTRGGVATTLNEIVKNKEFGILIEEKQVPVSKGVRSACELLGFDPLYIANEGKALLVVAHSSENAVLNLLHNEKYGQEAKTIGQITKDNSQKVAVKTRYAVVRSMDMLTADPMPRIC